MKRIFICMAAVSMLAACSKDDGITDAIDRGETGGSAAIETPAESYTTYVSVATENGDTRATYDKDLAPMWEAGDVICLHQMTAGNGGDNSLQELALTEGENTSTAKFGADVTLGEKGQRYFCFAYPSATVSTTDAIEAVGDITYNFRSTTSDSYGHYSATGTYKHIYTTSVGIEIPAEQDGSKWMPYMYAFTDDASTAGQLNSVHFTTLNGAICLRVKDTDGTSPKKLSSITISTKDGKPIAGTYAITSTSEGTLDPLTGDESGYLREGGELDKAYREDARINLENKARATSPATMSGISAPEVVLSEGKSEIKVTNIPPEIAATGEYYINIAPVTTDGFTITLTDGAGLSHTFDTKPATIGASQRKGYNITWEKDAIGVEFDTTTGELMTSYSYYLNNDSDTANNTDAYTICGATIKGKVNVSGTYKLSDITHYGLRVVKKDGTEVKEVKEVGYSYSNSPIDSATKTFEFSLTDNLGGQSLGEYEYYLYIKTTHGDRMSSRKPLYITGLPYTYNASSGQSGWTTSGTVEFKGSYVKLGYGSSSIERSDFYVPDKANINVTGYSEFACREGSTYQQNTFSLYINGNEATKYDGEYFNDGLFTSGESDFFKKVHHNFTGNGTLTTTNKTIKLHNSGTNTVCYTLMSKFTLQYGNKQ